MAEHTTDPNDSRLTHGSDEEPVPQAKAYLVLFEEERREGFVRPYRVSYRHTYCGEITTMSEPLVATYARDPNFYKGRTYCTRCLKHRPLSEFTWLDGSVVGT